ncbi:cytochrome P450 [Yoonia sp. SS1-5]|uniref:Cytochrome P450 n=1 Tax=Yoonia rhodophyticola TaxID=3137370 RepID=A0AAN0M8C2_9RHOB
MKNSAPPSTCPRDDIDLYADEVIRNPWPHYARLREKGPVVWMTAHGNYAFTQYDVVRSALRRPDVYVSGKGVAADDFGCAHLQGNTVASDGARHDALRGAMQPPLTPKAVQTYRARIEEVAAELVDAAVAKGSIDAVEDLAQGLPLAVVRDLVGLPDFGRENMLKWAAAAFDVLGVQNARGQAACPAIQEMREFIGREVTPAKLKPGSWTHRISEMARTGDIDPDLAPFAIRDYMNPSLDTTISAIGHLIYYLARDPSQFERLKADRTLIPNAVHEAIRLGTPIRSFTRHVAAETVEAGIVLPQDARVMMLFASANRDETVFADPDTFDMSRKDARRHLGFGAGVHMCVGMHLALLEVECLIARLVDKVSRLQLLGHDVVLNNSICAFARLQVRLN